MPIVPLLPSLGRQRIHSYMTPPPLTLPCGQGCGSSGVHRLSLEYPDIGGPDRLPRSSTSHDVDGGPTLRAAARLGGIYVPAIPSACTGQQGGRRCPFPARSQSGVRTQRRIMHPVAACTRSIGSSGATRSRAGVSGAARQAQEAFPGWPGVRTMLVVAALSAATTKRFIGRIRGACSNN